MIRHIKNKKKCEKTLFSMEYSKDQILILSLLPTNTILPDEVKDFKNLSLLDNNKDNLINVIINNTGKKSLKKCIYCDKVFDNNIDLRKHILINCFMDELKKDNKNQINITNSNNNNITNNIPINITQNITLEIKSPISFNKDWDLKKMSEDDKMALLHSMKMYTNFLRKILENDENLNVIIDNETTYVYENEKYIKMNLPDLLDKTMFKINKQLNDINCNNEEMIEESLYLSKKHIKEKFDKYKSDNQIKNKVNQLLSNIYEDKKDEAIKISKKTTNILDEGY